MPINLLQWNVDGLQSKLIELRYLLKNLHIQVTVLQETHLRPAQPTPKFPGFQAFRRDRPNQRRGGLLTIVSKNIPASDYVISTDSDDTSALKNHWL